MQVQRKMALPSDVALSDRPLLETLRRPQLQTLLRERGLPTTGKKDELVTRILDFDADPPTLREQRKADFQKLSVPKLKRLVKIYCAGYLSGNKDALIERLLVKLEGREAAPFTPSELLAAIDNLAPLSPEDAVRNVDLLQDLSFTNKVQPPASQARSSYRRPWTAWLCTISSAQSSRWKDIM